MTIAFDPNGAMYVTEMRTYMQDIDGNKQMEPVSLVSKHVSSKGDGVFDKHSVYLKDLLLPRMLLPLDDRVLLGVTNTLDLTIHGDTNGDGVADTSKLWFKGGPRGGNMEHQPSGLVWGLDNWIYTTYNSYRLRWNGENTAPLQENIPGTGSQWGLAQDNDGRMWWSNAGGERGLLGFQIPSVYGSINPSSQKAPGFDITWPLVGVRDYQGGPGKSREDGTLNHFTGCGGQTVYRGDRLPAELRNNVFLPEPVGRLIRRAVVTEKDGFISVQNPHGESEFLRSRDLCFRPLNMTTGPDGCLYIVDMYRGIIQEGNWVREGSYLRKVVQQYGFQNNVSRGRIWRLVHKDHQPGPQPRMLDETPQQWVAHLSHPNGWWRDTAQRLLIVKNDRSTIPALQNMAAGDRMALARMHALWTLEGMNALKADLVRHLMSDSDPVVRRHAVRVSEAMYLAGDQSFANDYVKAHADQDGAVRLQAVLTAKRTKLPKWEEMADQIATTSNTQGIGEIVRELTSKGPSPIQRFNGAQRQQYQRGMKNYQEVCAACHGADGRGTPIAGTKGATLAPPLGGSKTVNQGDGLMRVMLHGLTGPIEGKTYESMMIPQGNNTDEWLADVASYVKNSFGNNGPFMSAAEVASLRKKTAERKTPWTIEELRTLYPQPIANRSGWKLTSSHGAEKLQGCIDGKDDSRWDTGAHQVPGMWFAVELPADTAIAGIELDTAKSANDSPHTYEVLASMDGKKWTSVAKGQGVVGKTTITFPSTKLRHLRINQLGKKQGLFWSIHELQLLAAPTKVK